MILPKLIFAAPLPNGDGYTWTLPSRLGAFLRKIEEQYGERDKSWTILGIEFENNGPQIWYPGNCKNISIQLAPNALQNEMLACYQLAHEAVHLLAPSGGRRAPLLEEGLATAFSEEIVLKEFNATNVTPSGKYSIAADKVRNLLSIDPNAIKKLREVEPAFFKMTEETFETAGLKVGKEVIRELLAKF